MLSIYVLGHQAAIFAQDGEDDEDGEDDDTYKGSYEFSDFGDDYLIKDFIAEFKETRRFS